MRTNNGFVGIVLLVIMAIGVGIGSTIYFAKKDLPNPSDLIIETPISESAHTPTSTIKYAPVPVQTVQQSVTEGSGDFRTHVSNYFNLEFALQKDLFVHENTKDRVIEIDKYAKSPNDGGETDATYYDVQIMIRDLPKGTESYTLQQHLARLQKPYTNEEGDALRKYGLEPKVTIENISGVKVIQVPEFADLSPYIRITYYLFHNGKEYRIAPSSYENKGDVNILDDVVMSLKFY